MRENLLFFTTPRCLRNVSQMRACCGPYCLCVCRHVSDVEELNKKMSYSLMQEEFFKVSFSIVCNHAALSQRDVNDIFSSSSDAPSHTLALFVSSYHHCVHPPRPEWTCTYSSNFSSTNTGFICISGQPSLSSMFW